MKRESKCNLFCFSFIHPLDKLPLKILLKLTCDIGLYDSRLAPAMSVDIAPGISECPAVVLRVQKKLSALGFESTVQEI